MKPWASQEEVSDLGLEVLREHGLVYFAMEERTGKSLSALLTVQKSTAKKLLILTKAKALKGWNELLQAYTSHGLDITVTTYGKAKALRGKFDLAILDEAHNYISSYPNPSKTWFDVKQLVYGLPLIYISATPHAQSYSQLYHQFALSAWSPWHRYSSFKAWFKSYGIPEVQYLSGRTIDVYHNTIEDKVLNDVKHLFITKTRKQMGFEHEPKDKLHYIDLNKSVKEAYNYLLKNRVIEVQGEELLADTPMKLRTALHMLEGGTAKLTLHSQPAPNTNIVQCNKKAVKECKTIIGYVYETYYDLANDEKIQYIKQTFGDSTEVVIMYNYIAEGHKLRKAFKFAEILQATSFAEGVDLHDRKHLIVYSQDFSTARHTQRRARQANKKRKEPITVHFLLVKKGISEQVYKTVSLNKQNFVDSVFQREQL